TSYISILIIKVTGLLIREIQITYHDPNLFNSFAFQFFTLAVI
ncbi:hypothetical protein LINPERHAP2_LOCUS35344, partial [Linum perenne]